jgi:hypothetical protein
LRTMITKDYTTHDSGVTHVGRALSRRQEFVAA